MVNFSDTKIYIERELGKKIKKYLDKREIIAIVGPRQCGKTTLMENIYKGLKNANFINFEDREKLELFVKDEKGFAELHVKGFDYIFIDEFQYAKDGGKKLKYIYDTYKTKIIISGSSVSELSIQSIKYLVGRIFIFNMYPLSFSEFLNYKDSKLYGLYIKGSVSEPVIEKINTYLNEFMIYGGYPRVALSENQEEKIEVLKNIYNTYFLKEIKEILQIQEDFKLSQLIKVLSIQLGGIMNYSSLNSIGFSYNELIKNLNILKKTFICLDVRPFFTNKKKEIVKSPKLYFLDAGFRNVVINNFQEIEDRTDLGSLYENFVASELAKKDIEPRYWRTKVGAEVDFITENGKIIPIEVKSRINKTKITRSLRSFISEYKPKTGFVFSKKIIGEFKLNSTKILFYPLFNISRFNELIKT